ncbi:MAG TPA: hypothetical protein VF459_09370 [Caulobacteraceae bacterium]
MIKPSFLRAQVAKSRISRRTTPFLRRLVGSVVDKTAHEHYGAAYPTKCLQTAWGVQVLLRRLGLESRLWMGAFCAAEIFAAWGHDGWGGFWDQDHHIWLTTEFNEIVDLSVAQMHGHPRSRRDDGVAMPPLWWDDVGTWPQVIRYLPDSPIRVGFTDPADTADLTAFETKLLWTFDQILARRRLDEIEFGPFLDNVDGMNRLHQAGHPWLVRGTAFIDRRVAFPAWIREREAELIAGIRAGIRAPSRLAHRTDLVADPQGGPTA